MHPEHDDDAWAREQQQRSGEALRQRQRTPAVLDDRAQFANLRDELRLLREALRRRPGDRERLGEAGARAQSGDAAEIAGLLARKPSPQSFGQFGHLLDAAEFQRQPRAHRQRPGIFRQVRRRALRCFERAGEVAERPARLDPDLEAGERKGKPLLRRPREITGLRVPALRGGGLRLFDQSGGAAFSCSGAALATVRFVHAERAITAAQGPVQLAGQRPRRAGASMQVNTPVSVGELIDKLTILEIKLSEIVERAKLDNVRREYETLVVATPPSLLARVEVAELRARLRDVNGELWRIEDEIRAKERARAFDDEFIALARAVLRHQRR